MIGFEQIVGQDAAIQSLLGAYRADRLPHGLIFAGPMGVGKATTAAALAGLFLCEAAKDDRACGVCQSCVAMSAGSAGSASSHPDYHVITKELARVYDKTGTSKATQLAINVVRYELAAPAARKTVLGRGKVFVVEEAELMTPAAQNAILKTLEEPWGRTLIILLTTDATALLATVRSRCQTIPFAALEKDVVIQELRRRGIKAATASAAAELCDGSLGLALRWIEDGVVESAGELNQCVDAALAGESGGDLADLLRTLADKQAQKTLERDDLASKDAATRDALAMYLSLAARQLRLRLAVSAGADQMEKICQAIDAVARAQQYLDANVNVALVLEQIGLALAASE